MPSTQNVILFLCTVILACSCGGIFLVRLSHPLLRGLTWLGMSFACGGFAASLYIQQGKLSPLLVVLVADLLVLMAFILVHVAVLDFIEAKSFFSPLSAGLFVTVVAGCLVVIYGHPFHKFEVALVDFTVAVQVLNSARVLLGFKRPATRRPVLFFASLLVVFAALNLTRCVIISLGILSDPVTEAKLQELTYVIYLAAVLGSAFSFFWMAITLATSQLEDIASTDALTGIPNRRLFLMMCDKELARIVRSRSTFSLLLIDLDHFKRVNDEHGHAVGDEVLCEAVKYMQQEVRTSDMLARWGGEEFAVLLPDTTPETALAVAERIRMVVEAARIHVPLGPHIQAEDTILRLTLSVGLSTYLGPGDTIHDMLSRADRRLYKAKSAGRNQVSTGIDSTHLVGKVG